MNRPAKINSTAALGFNGTNPSMTLLNKVKLNSHPISVSVPIEITDQAENCAIFNEVDFKMLNSFHV